MDFFGPMKYIAPVVLIASSFLSIRGFQGKLNYWASGLGWTIVSVMVFIAMVEAWYV